MVSLFVPATLIEGSTLLTKLSASNADIFSVGAIVQWWTMISIVAADVAAYFCGKRFGRTQVRGSRGCPEKVVLVSCSY